ncbi:hypothetical protein KR222_008493 [Zaprionus bogoriensis]|nr:hypothetical protein KR222_008493 [Zaprionus bogoriensis]
MFPSAAALQLSLPTDPTYYAGVVEYPLAVDAMATAKDFIEIIGSQEADGLDIIVFPEYVLNSRLPTFVPDPAQNVTPCFAPDYEYFFVELSCAARGRAMYVVINVNEKELCAHGAGSDSITPCPASGVRKFNTNVVFDRSGRVISRYRKTHLWRQEYHSSSVMREPQLATFATDFGVTFGHFICFDMLFYEPAMRLLLERNVTDVIYPTFWFSELPFLTALQLQEGWAYGNDVNLLAADGSQPDICTTGSGIYAGRAGRLVAEIYETPTQRLLTAHVPKRNRQPEAESESESELPAKLLPAFSPQAVTTRYTGLATHRDFNVDVFSTELLQPDFLNVSRRTLCHEARFCCEFSLQRRQIEGSGTVAGAESYRYRLGAYWGNETTFIRVDRSEQAICALFACLSEDLFSCGRIFPANRTVVNSHYFESISIVGVFPAAPRRLIIPSTLDGVMLPLDVAQYSWTESPAAVLLQETAVELALTSPKNDLLTFGIWANYFTNLTSSHNLDHMQPGWNATHGVGSSAVPSLASCLWLLLALAVLRTV